MRANAHRLTNPYRQDKVLERIAVALEDIAKKPVIVDLSEMHNAERVMARLAETTPPGERSWQYLVTCSDLEKHLSAGDRLLDDLESEAEIIESAIREARR